MRHPRPRRALLAAAFATVLIAALPAAAAPRPASFQTISLNAATVDGSARGVSELTATRENNGFRLRGFLRSNAGCVKLMAVTMHWGDYLGGDEIRRSCETGVLAGVDAWTHHPDVVLVAIVPHGPDWESRIVGLTG